MIRLHRKVWIQLGVLGSVTVIAGAVMLFGFVQAPALMGVGRYQVTLELPRSGGLYPTSVVTYRGDEIGRVTSVDVTDVGVRAVLTLESDTPVPADVSAAVHSRSAIGEQFVELTPNGAGGPNLRDGDAIAAGRVSVPADIAGLLDATNTALQAIPRENLRTLVDEADTAVGGLGRELARIVDGSTAIATDAGTVTDQLTTLIDQSPEVLDSQARTADSIQTWASRMASVTGQFAAQDAAFGDLLNQGGPALREGQALFDRFAPALPVLLANMVSLGDIAVTYRADLEQLLVLYPQGTAVMSAITTANANTKQAYRGIYLDFNLNLNWPPPCNTGFLPARQQRIPTDVDAPDRPSGELYCRVPQNSDLNVRGVRNIPCETKPWKRAPTVEICESDEEYVPLNDGYNWKGDPNATLSGQGVPQYPPGVSAPGEPPPPIGGGNSNATEPAGAPQPTGPIAGTSVGGAPQNVAVAVYDPATGSYIGPDGRRYTQRNLAQSGERSWESMLVPSA